MLANALSQVRRCHVLIFFAGKRAPTSRDYGNAQVLWVRSGRAVAANRPYFATISTQNGPTIAVDPFFTPLLLYFKCAFNSCDACSIAERTSGTWLTTFNRP